MPRYAIVPTSIFAPPATTRQAKRQASAFCQTSSAEWLRVTLAITRFRLSTDRKPFHTLADLSLSNVTAGMLTEHERGTGLCRELP